MSADCPGCWPTPKLPITRITRCGECGLPDTAHANDCSRFEDEDAYLRRGHAH